MKEATPWQLALHIPGTDDALDNALGYNLDLWHQDFVSFYVQGNQGVDAVRYADAMRGMPTRSAKSAGAKAARILQGRARASNAVLLAIKNRRTRAAYVAKFTENELCATVRRLEAAGFGWEKVKKTLVKTTEDGSTILEDIEVYDPSLAAVAKAADLKARILGKAGDDGAEAKQSASIEVRFVNAPDNDVGAKKGNDD